MPIAAGTDIAQYTVIEPIGRGAMGQVYRARATRLGRDVAIKGLAGNLSDGVEGRTRLLSEAQILASLHHPNIVSIFDVGEYSGSPFVVVELIEGTSLREVLRKGRVPLKQMLDLAVQIGEGLATAHRAGIVHRDLKPENLMITPDGLVKFTRAGMIRGTPGYASPEQAFGREVDYPSDQFSFGLILFELCSGRQAFTGASSVEILAAIIRDEAPPIPPNSPHDYAG